MSEEYTEKQLRDLITSFRNALQICKDNLSPEVFSKLKSKEEVDALTELQKLSKLVFAYSTKIGIAFRPPVSISAAYTQLEETAKVMSMILPITVGFTTEKYGNLFRSLIIDDVLGLVSRFIGLLDELEGMDFTKKKDTEDKKDGVDGRLSSVGLVWDICQKLQKALEDGKIGLLKYRIKLSIDLVEDGASELEEWLENPEVLDDFDPFGMLNGKDEENEEEEDDEEEERVVDPEVIELGKTWHNKIKLLKLLLSSLIKSLPTEESSVTGPDADNFNKEQEKLVEHIDDLIANFFMNSSIDKLQELIKKVQEKSDLLIDLVKSLNKQDEKKTQWLTIWNDKFKQ